MYHMVCEFSILDFRAGFFKISEIAKHKEANWYLLHDKESLHLIETPNIIRPFILFLKLVLNFNDGSGFFVV